MTRAMENYIYYKNQDWRVNKGVLRANFDMDISAAYIENANKLDAKLGLNNLPDNFVEEVQEALDFRNTAPQISEEINSAFFQEIQNFVSGELSSYVLTSGGLTVGNANLKLKNMILDAKQLNDILRGFQKIIDKIDQFDSGFQELGKTDISFLDNASMNKTKIAYDSVKEFIQKYTGIQDMSGLGNINKEINRLIGLILGDLKGGLFEFADYIHSIAIVTVIEETEKQVKILGGKLTGTSKDYISSEELKKALGQDSFQNKADNVITVATYDGQGVEVQLNLGISDKSYKSGRANGKSLATKVSWPSVMYESGLTDSSFEYYYANLMVHERSLLKNNSNEYNAYLAAKASAFLISGFSGGSTSQAYFVRYADQILYVPKLLRTLSGKSKGLFKITPEGTVDNTFVETEEDYITDAYARTKNTMSGLRQHIKFNAKR